MSNTVEIRRQPRIARTSSAVARSLATAAALACGALALTSCGTALPFSQGVATTRPTGLVPSPAPAGTVAPPASTTAPAPAPAAPARAGKWAVRLDAEGNSNSEDWPDACTMVQPADIQRVVPGAGPVHTAGQHGAFLGGGETAHYADCKYSFLIPDTKYGDSYIDVSIEGISDAATSAESWERMRASSASSAIPGKDQYQLYDDVAGAKCFWDDNELQCLKGTWTYWILGLRSGDGDYSGTPELFVRHSQWRNGTLVPIARIIADRIA